MALTSKDSLLKALYGAGIQPAAMNTATGAAALTGADTSANTTPAPNPRMTTERPSYTTPTYRAPKPPPAPAPTPPVTIVNNPVPPPTPPLATGLNGPAASRPPHVSTVPSQTDEELLAEWKARFDAQGNLIPNTGWVMGDEFQDSWKTRAGSVPPPPSGPQNIQNPPAGNPPPGNPPPAAGGMQYYNAQGQPYNGEDTGYYYNTAEGKWYSGDKATQKLTPLGAIAPWNTPPGGGQQNAGGDGGAPPGGPPGAPQGATYYGPGGGQYDPATDKTSYWYNAAEGQWYQGDTATGKVSIAAGGPPWMDTTSDPRLSGLIDKLTSMPYDREYVGMMGGKLREQLQAGAGTAREEIANRLGGAGVFGGAAQSQLRGVDAATALGTSQGMGQIYQTAMGNAYEDRRAGLGALQSKEWQNLQKMLGGTNAELQMAQLNQQGTQFTQQQRNDMGMLLLQLMQNAEGNEWNQLMMLYQTVMSGGV